VQKQHILNFVHDRFFMKTKFYVTFNAAELLLLKLE